MEGLLNYAYVQTNSLNLFDELGHALGITLVSAPGANNACGYQTGPDVPDLQGSSGNLNTPRDPKNFAECAGIWAIASPGSTTAPIPRACSATSAATTRRLPRRVAAPSICDPPMRRTRAARGPPRPQRRRSRSSRRPNAQQQKDLQKILPPASTRTSCRTSPAAAQDLLPQLPELPRRLPSPNPTGPSGSPTDNLLNFLLGTSTGTRNESESLAASPTMVGAITTLIVIVAVFLAYNANNGLPFVPTYRVSAELCDAARLGPNNEVRIGGNRVGVVESIETVPAPPNSGCQTADGSSASTVAKLNLKLDKSADPLPADSTIRVRYRSSFGLKYLEITRGDQRARACPRAAPCRSPSPSRRPSSTTSATPSTPPPARTAAPCSRDSATPSPRRGASLNQAIGALNPLFANLKPGLQGASPIRPPSLVRFFPELADAARIVAPVAVDNAEQFTNGAIAFGAISSDPQALRDTISGGPPTLKAGIAVAAGPASRSSRTSPISRACCARACGTCAPRCRS